MESNAIVSDFCFRRLLPNFATCKVLGLLDDDAHWKEALREAAAFNSPHKFRELFAVVVVFCNANDPLDLWIIFRESISVDYFRLAQRINQNTNFDNSPHMYDL